MGRRWATRLITLLLLLVTGCSAVPAHPPASWGPGPGRSKCRVPRWTSGSVSPTRAAAASEGRSTSPCSARAYPPFPYRSEDVSYRSGNVNLAGTLTLPQGGGPFTAVLLLTGSGAQDRDETLFGHKPFLLLADALTRAGYAVLRVDDRGVGGSGGDLATASYDVLVGDALTGVAYLKGRSEIARIGLFGHSEGGYLAPLAAQRSDDVAFVILMAGPAVPGEDVLLLQNRLLFEAAGASPEQVNAQMEYLRERPRPALDALHVPVLAFFGGKDLQVPPAQSEPVLRQRLADNPDSTIRTFPQLNHLMQPATIGTPEEYAAIETTISPEVLDTVTQWLRARY